MVNIIRVKVEINEQVQPIHLDLDGSVRVVASFCDANIYS